MSHPPLYWLGPKTSHSRLGEIVRSISAEGRIATITAGWEEFEDELEILDAPLSQRCSPLTLFARAEKLWKNDRELYRAYESMHRARRELRHYYNMRLGHAMAALSTLLREPIASSLLPDQVQSAIASVKSLDHEHLERVEDTILAFKENHSYVNRPSIASEREEISALLKNTELLVIAGGHVDVLLSLLKLFDLRDLIRSLPIIAWSAGTMVLSDRVVLYHDSPPHGESSPEVLDRGLGLGPSLIPLPHARARLKLDDAIRVGRFARRFSPATCVVMESDTCLLWDGRRWTSLNPALCLSNAGHLEEIQSWEPRTP